MKSNFTLLTDATEMKTHPVAVRKLHEEAQALIVKQGVRKVAELHPNDLTTLQLESLSKDTSMPRNGFSCRIKAETWLDE